MSKRITVSLFDWEAGMYNPLEWMCVGYSEFAASGVPKYAELARIGERMGPNIPTAFFPLKAILDNPLKFHLIITRNSEEALVLLNILKSTREPRTPSQTPLQEILISAEAGACDTIILTPRWLNGWSINKVGCDAVVTCTWYSNSDEYKQMMKQAAWRFRSAKHVNYPSYGGATHEVGASVSDDSASFYVRLPTSIAVADLTRMADGRWYFSRLNVPASYRKFGIGSALMESVAKWADDNKAVILNEVNPYGDMELRPLLTFYEKYGFVQTADNVMIRTVDLPPSVQP